MMITGASCERSDHKCGRYPNGSWASCDQGRCCSIGYYCGDTADYCDRRYCWYQCPAVAGYSQSNYEVAETGGGGLLTHLSNATLSGHYLNGNDDDLVKVATANASFSSSSSLASPLSCATSLARLSLASRHKYPFAALRAPRLPNNVTATRCGRCLKVTNVGVAGIPNQVKVRIAHEHNKPDLELDFNTFKQVDTNGSGIIKGRILVKYQFDNC